MLVCSFKKRQMTKRKFFKITFHIWSIYRKHCGGLTSDLYLVFYMMSHIICVLYLGCGIIIENFQGCAQEIKNLSKINSVYAFVFMLADVCLWMRFHLAVLKSLTAFWSWFMKILLSWEQSGYWPKWNGCMKGIQSGHTT